MSDTPMVSAMRDALAEEVKEHRTWYTIQAILMVLVGVVALVYPVMSTVSLAIVLGWLLLFGGIVQGISLIGAGKVPYFWLQLISAILSVVVGVLFLQNPGTGVGTLVLLMILYFIAAGFTKIVLSLTIRPFKNWGWVLVGGIISVGIGIFLMSNPQVALVTVGILFGIQMISEAIGIFMLMRE